MKRRRQAVVDVIASTGSCVGLTANEPIVSKARLPVVISADNTLVFPSYSDVE